MTEARKIIFNPIFTKSRRKELRLNQTEAEKKVWSRIRNKQILEYKFYRQYGIGKYIVDFYCARLKLVVEIDGDQHYLDDGIKYDEERASYMKSEGIETIRFSNIDVLKNIEGVITEIEKKVAKLDLSNKLEEIL